jgi:hypothetical protein
MKLSAAICALAFALPVALAQDNAPPSVPFSLAGPVVDAFSAVASTPEGLAALEAHALTVRGEPWDGTRIGLHGKARAEWQMSTPEPGEYVLVLHLNSGDERPGVFTCFVGDDEVASEEFNTAGRYAPLLKCYLIAIPEGQTITRMSLTGSGVYFLRAELTRRTDNPLVGEDGELTQVTQSGYRTVLARGGEPACVVLVPKCEPERELATALAERFDLPTAPEPDASAAFPAWSVADVDPNTNLIVVTGARGGPLAQALRRAGFLGAGHATPGAGGYLIRTIPRPFRGAGNVIAICASDEDGLRAGLLAFEPTTEEATDALVWDEFLIDVPGQRWAELRNYRHSLEPEDEWFEKQRASLSEPHAGLKGSAVARTYVSRTASFGHWYWLTLRSDAGVGPRRGGARAHRRRPAAHRQLPAARLPGGPRGLRASVDRGLDVLRRSPHEAQPPDDPRLRADAGVAVLLAHVRPRRRAAVEDPLRRVDRRRHRLGARAGGLTQLRAADLHRGRAHDQ